MSAVYHEVRREPDGAERAVLLLHGILSAPQYFDFLADAIPPDCAVYGILFAGHGGRPDALGRVTMDMWRGQVSDAVDDLRERYRSICIIAHSMGTLFALQTAAAHPDLVRRMVLLNVPLYPNLTLQCALDSVLLACGADLHGLREDVGAMQDAFSMEHDARLWHYAAWLPRYAELFSLMREVRVILPENRVPAVAFQSAHDELVAMKSIGLLKATPKLRTVLLRDSTHFYYPDTDRHRILHAVRCMLNQV